MLEQKVAQTYTKVAPKVATTVFVLRSKVFIIAPRVTKYLGYYWKKNCHQELSKIAQSGHTVWEQKLQSVTSRCHERKNEKLNSVSKEKNHRSGKFILTDFCNKILLYLFKNWTNPGLFFIYLQTHITNFTTNRYVNMSIQYTVLGFELTTFGRWVSSHNH